MLRQLLVSIPTLSDEANYGHGLKFRFLANVDEPNAELEPGMAWIRADGLDPDSALWADKFWKEAVERLDAAFEGISDPEVRAQARASWQPAGRNNPPPKELTRDELLKVPMMRIGAQNITVLDLIKYAANVKGGVHRGKRDRGKRKKDAQRDLALANIDTRTVGLEMSTHSLRAVARIVLRGLTPLVEEIRRTRPDLAARIDSP